MVQQNYCFNKSLKKKLLIQQNLWKKKYWFNKSFKKKQRKEIYTLPETNSLPWK